MNENITRIIQGASVLIVLMLAFFLFRKLGLTSKKRSESDVIFEDIMIEQIKAEQSIKSTKYLDPQYWKTANPSKLLTVDQAKDFAEDLHDGFDNWTFSPPYGDDEAAIYAVFEALNNGYQLSQICEIFQKMYGESLRGKLIEQLDSSELLVIQNIINKYK